MTTDTNIPPHTTPPMAKRSITGRLPCPFCASVDLEMVSIRDPNGGPGTPLMLMCKGCGASGPEGTGTAASICSAWDLRLERARA